MAILAPRQAIETPPQMRMGMGRRRPLASPESVAAIRQRWIASLQASNPLPAKQLKAVQ